MTITRFLLLMISGLFVLDVYGQKPTETLNKNQIDLFLGGSGINKIYDGTSFGMGLDHRFNKLLLSSQFLVNRTFYRLKSESSLYYNIDVLAGLYQIFNRIDVSLATGVGLALRNEGDIATNREKHYVLPGIPVRLKVNYLIRKRFAAGIGAYVNINKGNSIYCMNLNLGYRF